MVDEYPRQAKHPAKQRVVQIPHGRWILACCVLWSFSSVQIPLWSMNTRAGYLGSCLSLVQIPLWSMNTISMCHGIFLSQVQIPLWSMNTCQNSIVNIFPTRFRFLYGRWILLEVISSIECYTGSDSSMVDEYFASCQYFLPVLPFRFLYGRWIRLPTHAKYH